VEENPFEKSWTNTGGQKTWDIADKVKVNGQLLLYVNEAQMLW